jgi:hypothetical protein
MLQCEALFSFGDSILYERSIVNVTEKEEKY